MMKVSWENFLVPHRPSLEEHELCQNKSSVLSKPLQIDFAKRGRHSLFLAPRSPKPMERGLWYYGPEILLEGGREEKERKIVTLFGHN